MSWIPKEFLLKIPKTDLHVHLDGSLRLNTLIELAKESNVTLPAYTEEELKKTVFREHYKDLPEYLEGFRYTGAVMRTASNLERISYEFGQDNYLEGVRYYEVRFAPQLLASIGGNGGLSIREVILAVNAGLKRAKDEFNSNLVEDEAFYDYGIIVCAMRMFPPCEYFDALKAIHEDLDQERLSSLASETLIVTSAKCRDEDKIPIVALDIAGAENGFPNKIHKHAFDLAHKFFFNKTVHAGEGYGPESIFQAVIDLHAERIGHGFHLFSEHLVSFRETDKNEYVRKLVKYVCDRRICLEVCLTSNLGTMPELKLEDHTLRTMIDNGVSLTLNTDNRLVSDTTVIKELTKAVSTFDLSPKQLREIVITGFKRSFYHGEYSVKRKYMRTVMNQYDRLAEEYDIQHLYAKHQQNESLKSELDK
jgi:adenosine deaminase